MQVKLISVFLFLVFWSVFSVWDKIDRMNREMDAEARRRCFHQSNTLSQFYRCYGQ